MSFFSVVTKISTDGNTLKLRWSTFRKHFLYNSDYKNNEYITQIAIGFDNKGHIVDFLNFLCEKNDILFTKKYKKFLDDFEDVFNAANES